MDKIKEILESPQEDFYRRNVGKKIMAKILTPTEEEIKQKQAEYDTTS